jgi:hypothetical protein
MECADVFGPDARHSSGSLRQGWTANVFHLGMWAKPATDSFEMTCRQPLSRSSGVNGLINALMVRAGVAASVGGEDIGSPRQPTRIIEVVGRLVVSRRVGTNDVVVSQAATLCRAQCIVRK